MTCARRTIRRGRAGHYAGRPRTEFGASIAVIRLVCHQLLRTADNRWYWYQRYHHLLVDGFSFPAITRQIAAIYRAWQRGEATPDSPFTPFAEVVEEYQRYYGSDGWQRDKQFWQEQRGALPAPVSLSDAPLAGRATGTEIWRLKLDADAATFSRLAAGAPQCQRADLALALTALWLGRLCGRMDYAAGFIFMRRMGSAALTATGPVLNVLPLAINIDAQETLAELALRLAGQLKKMRRHQRYDAEQIVRDSGKAAGDEPLFGPVLNIKVFDYVLDIDGVQAVTHTLATGPVNDLELALFPDEAGGLSLEVLANKQRYDEATLRAHVERLSALLAQFAADPALRCGEANMLSARETQRLAEINHTGIALPATTLSALVAEQALKTPDAPALADARCSSATAKCASRWWRWPRCCARAGLSPAIAWRWRCRVRYSSPWRCTPSLKRAPPGCRSIPAILTIACA
ncbi:Enterobactin synthase component F [Raoultella terrigena]|uniref:Enterobactin synthase component F n=1 Tax=Raoultella terrigena TaxID=577 RepID=A0A3P8K125_RAOTE|nr:Enterobactin synthase component F [Raoultella terrigena]